MQKKWNKETKLWELPDQEAKPLGFTDRLVVE
jgi:hypothetical protein